MLARSRQNVLDRREWIRTTTSWSPDRQAPAASTAPACQLDHGERAPREHDSSRHHAAPDRHHLPARATRPTTSMAKRIPKVCTPCEGAITSAWPAGRPIAPDEAPSSRRRGAGQLEVERPATLLNARRAARTCPGPCSTGSRKWAEGMTWPHQRRRIADSLARRRPRCTNRPRARAGASGVQRLPKSAKLNRHAVGRRCARLGAAGRSRSRRRRRRRRPRRPAPGPQGAGAGRRSRGCRPPWCVRRSSASASRPSGATATCSAAAWPRKACW